MTVDIDVELPVRTVYNQWTQFEEFPQFMENVEEVSQLDDRTLRWRAEIAGVRREWTAQITEQSPDQRIAWKSTEGARNAGVVTFHALDDNSTRVTLQLEMDPQGLLETVADKVGFIENRAKHDLENFKRFIEARGQESGGYRGSIDRDARGAGAHPNEHAEDSSMRHEDDQARGNPVAGAAQTEGIVEERAGLDEPGRATAVPGNAGREAPYAEEPQRPGRAI
jgi:ribosome-associated toxin RatA of RatAB toxin-antitoxin module